MLRPTSALLVLLPLALCALAVSGSLTPIREAGTCAMLGTCRGQDIYERQVECVNNIPAWTPPFNNFGSQAIPTMCPQWQHRQWKQICCDWNQALWLRSFLTKFEALFSYCPACYTNIAFFMCELHCSPDQSLFLEVTSELQPNATLPAVVNSTSMRVSKEFAQTLFDSCADVRFWLNSERVVETFYNSTTPAEFLTAIGRKGLTADDSPIQIDANFTSSSDANSITNANFLYPCDTPDPNQQCRASDCSPTHRSRNAVELA